MRLTDEVQVMAQRVLTERGCNVQPGNSSSGRVSLTGSMATDRGSCSGTSSNRQLPTHSLPSSRNLSSKGEDACAVNAEASAAYIASLSLSNLKSAYLRAAANVPGHGSNSNSSSSSSSSTYSYSNSSPASHRPAAAAAGSARASGGVSVAVAEMRSNFLQAFKDDEKRLKEAAAEAAAAAAAAAAAVTSAGGISVSSLRSGWLEAQRQEAEKAAAEAAVAASLAAGKPRPQPARASSSGTWGPYSASKHQAATMLTGQRVLDKTQEVAQMAEQLLCTKRVGLSGLGCGGLMPATSGSFGAAATVACSAASAGGDDPVAAPLAYGAAEPVDLHN